MNQKTHSFHANGMHCASCVVLIENELNNLPEISSVKVSLKKMNVEVTGNFGDKEPSHIAKDLSEILKCHGYSLYLEKQKHNAKWSDFQIALPIAAVFIVLFIFLQRLGLVNLTNSENLSLGTAFIIGLIASVSTCMAVVGGLVLSLSANFAKEGDKIKPQILFHVSRFISFFFLGGLVGVLGSAFQLNPVGSVILGILVAIILLVLGLNLLDVFPWAKKLQFTAPSRIGKKIHSLKNLNHVLAPLLIGIATFFLPCGFTQSMQLYALTTGSFLNGALVMFVFSLGTFPVLAILSFSSLGLRNKKQSSVFFKTAGLIVIFFSVFNLTNSLAVLGVIPPIFNF